MCWLLHNNGNGLRWVDWKKIVFLFKILLIAQQFYSYHICQEKYQIFFFFLKNLMSRVDLTFYDMIVEEKCVFHVQGEHVTICRCVDFCSCICGHDSIALYSVLLIPKRMKLQWSAFNYCYWKSRTTWKYQTKCFHWFA